MALSPFRGFSDVQGEVDRLFNEKVGGLFSGRRGRGAARIWSPRCRRTLATVTWYFASICQASPWRT